MDVPFKIVIVAALFIVVVLLIQMYFESAKINTETYKLSLKYKDLKKKFSDIHISELKKPLSEENCTGNSGLVTCIQLMSDYLKIHGNKVSDKLTTYWSLYDCLDKLYEMLVLYKEHNFSTQYWELRNEIYECLGEV